MSLILAKRLSEKLLLQDLGMRKLAVKLLPRHLTEVQKNKRLTLCMDFLEQLREGNWFDRVVTGHETQCYR